MPGRLQLGGLGQPQKDVGFDSPFARTQMERSLLLVHSHPDSLGNDFGCLRFSSHTPGSI